MANRYQYRLHALIFLNKSFQLADMISNRRRQSFSFLSIQDLKWNVCHFPVDIVICILLNAVCLTMIENLLKHISIASSHGLQRYATSCYLQQGFLLLYDGYDAISCNTGLVNCAWHCRPIMMTVHYLDEVYYITQHQTMPVIINLWRQFAVRNC